MTRERYTLQTYALMRIVFGLVFLVLGLQKWGLFGDTWGLFGGRMVQIASLQGAAGVIETVCGALIMIGLFTKPAAFLASGEMAFAYFYIHQGLGALPPQNMGERAVLFCFAFLYIASRGAGIWSADSARR